MGQNVERDGLAADLEGAEVLVHASTQRHLASARTGSTSLRWPRTAGPSSVGSSRTAPWSARWCCPVRAPLFPVFRMRTIATAADHDMAMQDEQWLHAREWNGGGGRAPSRLVSMAGSIAATEMVKVLAGFGTPALIDHVWDHDALALTSTLRPVLKQPQCPACRKKRPPTATAADLDAAAWGGGHPG